jgi:PAS domain S-box-containing protein
MMDPKRDEEDLLRSAALQNASTIRAARIRAESDLLKAKDDLELKTRELAYSLAMMRATFESTTDGILVTDAGGHITDSNEKFLQMWRISGGIANRTQHSAIQDASARQLVDPVGYQIRLREIYASWPPETFDILEFADGRILERYSKIQKVSKMPVGRVWTYRDITESKRAERALQDQAEWFSVTLGSIGDAVITVDNACRVTFLNPIAAKYTGWSTSEAVGKPLGEVMRILNETTRQAATNPIDSALAEGRIVGLANHTILLSRDGVEHPIEDSAAPIKDPSGKIIGAVMVFHDVSDRREKERALARLYEGEQQARGAAEQANQAKDDFLAALSHELRTPLTPAIGILSSLSGDRSIPEELAADLEIVRRNVEVEARLIDDLLDITRISSGKMELHIEAVRVTAIIDEATGICRSDLEAKRLSLEREVRPGEKEIAADRLRVTQVLWNLLKNSIKFTPEGGKITIRTQTESHSDGERVVIEIQDTGMGIEPEEMDRLFKAFEQGGRHITQQYGGLGLGLAISSGIAASHGGSLTAFSRGRGQGSTFTLTLPCGDPHAAANSPGRSASTSTKAEKNPTLRILLVEDHADTATILTRLLRKMGHEVIHAPTVASALEEAARKSAGAGIDLVVSDVGLPDGSGLDMMRELSSVHGLRGIALSGFGRDSDIEQSMAAGFSRHLVKPINIVLLRKTILEMTLKE